MKEQVFKSNFSLVIMNSVFFVVIIIFIARIDLLFSLVLFVLIGFTIIRNDLIKQPYKISINELDGKVFINTKTLFLFDEMFETTFDLVSFSYKNEIAG
jgi:hypothetical protein